MKGEKDCNKIKAKLRIKKDKVESDPKQKIYLSLYILILKNKHWAQKEKFILGFQ